MRTWGRTTDEFGNKTWVSVETDAGGYNDAVWLTTLCQCLKLNLGESPFYAQYGIPAYQSVIQQIFPDFFVSQTQTRFAPYFASLTITKLNSPAPAYNVIVTTNYGSQISTQVPV